MRRFPNERLIMGLRVGGHLGPVYASKSVSGKGCLPALVLGVVIAPLFIWWKVTVPVLAVIVLSVVTIKIRDRRRAVRAAKTLEAQRYAGPVVPGPQWQRDHQRHPEPAPRPYAPPVTPPQWRR